MEVSRRRSMGLAAGGAVLLVVVAVAAGAPGAAQDRWQEFKRPNAVAGAPTPKNVFDRFGDLSGNRRYQYWSTALDAFKDKPLTGIGPGTFEFYWLQHGAVYEFVRDAHSLFVETLGELGLVGLLLLLGAFATVLVRGAAGNRGDPATRAVATAATAGVAAFCEGATVNWTWEIGVVPITTMVLIAVALAASRPAPLVRAELLAEEAGERPSLRVPRAAIVALSVAALAAIALPLASTAALRRSQDSVARSDLGRALSQAEGAASLQPYAATPALQRGLVLEEAGSYAAAAAAARVALAREPQNWRVWLVLSRLEAERGDASAALAAFRRARTLNPGSPVFARR
jgi:hypothetical protein